jgi:hypothetical protein
MAKKISLTINAKRYDIDIDDAFAPYLERIMREDFNVHSNNDLKLLLQAYVRQNYKLFELEQRVAALIAKIDTASND